MEKAIRLRRIVAVVLTQLLLTALVAGRAGAQGLSVAAASDLQAVLPVIAASFEKETGRKVTTSFGSSGNFFTQIQNGAPFDVFLSADIDYPTRLEASGSVVRGSVTQYATGHLVLWSRNDSGVDVKRGFAVLDDARVRHIAIANPDHAPYGRAAVAALRHEGVYERVRSKLVMGENISQAAQFAQTGSADVGLVALSLALSPAMKASGSYLEIPTSWYPPIAQAVAVVASSKQQALAQEFLQFLKRESSVRVLQSYGFAVSR
jgi:molybdate transport system substrate-binding protein